MASSSGAIRAGRAYVELYGDDSKLDRTLKTSQEKLKAWGSAISGAGTKMMLGGAAILAPLLASVKLFSDTGSELVDMSGRTGMAVEALGELGYAASTVGGNLADVELAVRKMQTTITEAGDGTKTATDSLTALGLSAARLEGLSPEEQFMRIAEGLAGISDPTKRAALAVDLFGRSGTKMLPMLAGGIDGLKALRQEAIRLGRLSAEEAEAADALGDAWGRVTVSLKMAAAQIGVALAPALMAIFDQVTAMFAPIMGLVKAFPQVATGAATAAVGLLAAGAALKVVGVAMTFIAAHPMVAMIAATAAAAIVLDQVLGDLTGVIIGVTAAWAVFTLNPTLLALTAIAAIAVTVGRAFSDSAASAGAFSDEAQKALAAGDKQRSAASGQIGQLQEMADKGRLNNEEMARAQDIIDSLTKTYGDLGLSIDGATGKIVGLTGAQAALNAQMMEGKRGEIRAAIEESQVAVAELTRQMQGTGDFSLSLAWRDTDAERAAIQAKIDQQMAKQKGLVAQLKGLKGGDLGLPGAAAPAELSGKVKDEAEKRLKDSLTYSLDLFDRQQQIRIGMIEDEHQREIELINQKYDHEIKAAQIAGKATGGLEQTRQLEITAAKKKHAQERADDAKKQQETEDAWLADYQDRVAEGEKGLQHDIERLQIEKTMKGRAREKALLDLEEKRAVEEAIAAGIDPDLVRKKYGLMGDIANAAETKTSVVGTFNAMVAGRLAGGGSAERTARATEQSAKTLKAIEQNMRVTTSNAFTA